MKLYIFHGVGVRALSQKVSSIKKEFNPLMVTEINGKEVRWQEARVKLANQSLFQSKRLVILEDPSDIKISEIAQDEHLTLMLIFSKTLPTSSPLLKTPQATIINFTEVTERSVFPFLDRLAEQNPKSLIELEKLYQEYGSQYLLTMVAYLLRRMIQTPKNLPPFAVKRLSKQKQLFPLSRLIRLYKLVLETDFRIKSGLLDEKIGLSMLAEQFITS